MTPRHLVLAAALGGSMFALHPAPAHAQTSTTGAIQGQIVDDATGEPLAGVTIVVTSPALQNAGAGSVDREPGAGTTALSEPGAKQRAWSARHSIPNSALRSSTATAR